jgi:hypothetical protein
MLGRKLCVKIVIFGGSVRGIVPGRDEILHDFAGCIRRV